MSNTLMFMLELFCIDFKPLIHNERKGKEKQPKIKQSTFTPLKKRLSTIAHLLFSGACDPRNHKVWLTRDTLEGYETNKHSPLFSQVVIDGNRPTDGFVFYQFGMKNLC